MLPIRSVVDGSTIGLRILTSRSDDENERWRSSEIRRPSRNSPPPTPQSTTTSTTTVTSTAAISSNKTVLPPWPSGVSWRPERLISAPFVTPAQVCLTMLLREIDPTTIAHLQHSISAKKTEVLRRPHEPTTQSGHPPRRQMTTIKRNFKK